MESRKISSETKEIIFESIKKKMFPVDKWGNEKVRVVMVVSATTALIGYLVSSIVVKNEPIEEKESNN